MSPQSPAVHGPLPESQGFGTANTPLPPPSASNDIEDRQNVRSTPETPVSLGQVSAQPPASVEQRSAPTPSRRSRGYSLRRAIFARGITRHESQINESSMELKQQSIQQTPLGPRHTQNRHKKDAAVIIAEDDLSSEEKRVGRETQLDITSGQNERRRPFHQLSKQFQLFSQRLFGRKEIQPSPEGRHVRVTAERGKSPLDERTGKPHIDNRIYSCRYTLWNFLPRQLVAQFSKLANFYFLVIGILQMIPGLSTTGTYTTIVPLLTFVGISMAKEGYDDLRRYRLDKEDNEREVDILDHHSSIIRPESPESQATSQIGYPETSKSRWQTEKWQDVKVGDVVLLERDCPVPADVILLHADEPTMSAYIETKSLDGETNLKTKKPLSDVSSRCGDLDAVAVLEAEFVVEDPNIDLYRFDGTVSVGGQRWPLTNNEIIYRGSILRHTPSALGLVIYTGEECKIRMNANKTLRIKAPALQARVNRVVVFVAALVFSMAFLLTGLYQVWRRTTERKSWYLNSARVPFGFILTSFIIMFNTMLPLSLYISLEIVKVAQIFLMNDIDMYDPESDTPMEPRTSTINEELGQVSYIFSDKTGTLTNNSMKFRKMSIAGTAWLHDIDLQQEALNDSHPSTLTGKKISTKGKVKSEDQQWRKSTTSVSGSLKRKRTSLSNSEWQPSTAAAASMQCGHTEQLVDFFHRRPRSVYTRKAKFFLLGLALCHTCVPEKNDEGNIRFQAASPDELALVDAAHDLGYTLSDRQAKSITIKIQPDGENEDPVFEVYEILDIIEFSSGRKRMSIVVKFPDGKIYVFTKGADTTISKLLRLAELADSTGSSVRRRTSQRKELDTREALRRKSMQTDRESRKSGSRSRSRSRPGLSSRRPTDDRSGSIFRGQSRSARQSVDDRSKDGEQDRNMSTPDASDTFYTPRQSMQISPRPSDARPLRQSIPRSDTGLSSAPAGGVDALIDENVAVDDGAVFERCFQHIDDFATEGLRTLLYAYKYISEADYQAWSKMYAEASTSLENRLEKMEAVGERLETSLELLGATAIEDKLQRGVPDAIDRFRRAGIKMWMLTGDKRETAINIGQSCRLIKSYSTITIIDHELGQMRETMTSAVNDIRTELTAHGVLVIDGQTLMQIDNDPSLKAIFTNLAVMAESVICCRASPSQKASLVKSIRTKVKGSVTLAIGDGANDIAMIQEAHIGIGIAGKEGLQAARTSDYSIAQFRFLLKLLLVHGRWNYVRVCKYTLGTFWKEMLFYLVQAMYQRWTGYTGTSLFEPWSLTMFNSLFTSLPVIFLGIFDKDLAPSTLLAVPELYNIGQRNRGFSFKLYAWWAALGAVEAVIVFFIVYGLYGEAPFTNDQSVYPLGVLTFTACVIIIAVKLQVLVLHNKSDTAISATVISIGGWGLWNLILSVLYDPAKSIYFVRRGLLDRFGKSLLWWATLLVAVSSILLLEVIIKTVQARLRPSDVDTFQALEKDPEVRKRFEAAAADLLVLSSEGASQDKHQIKREAQVQELLDQPRGVVSEGRRRWWKRR